MMLRAMGLSLLLTELIELSAALLLKKREDIGLIALANLMTNPAVVYLSLLTKALRPGLYPAAAAVTELLAVLAEGYAYKRRAAKIARDKAERYADDHRPDAGKQARGQRDARAVKNAR